MNNVKRAIIPAAGYGTRFLPQTKAVAKEMLPIVDVPSIEYVVEECYLSGITEICILIGRGKESILNHFDRNFELETALSKSGKTAEIELMNRFLGKVNFTFIRQPEMKGTGRAIELCKDFTQKESFAVLFGDDVMYNPENPVTKQLIDAYSKVNAPIVGVQELPLEKAVNYGVVVPGKIDGSFVELKAFKEKPKLDEVPSRYCSLGRFILTPEIFDYIKKTPEAKNGEIYLPTALELMAKEKSVFAYNFRGRRYDIGDKQGYIEATIEYALRNKDLNQGLTEYLKKLNERGYKTE